ncbi:hypothetical protein [Sutcliffiella rhizosphaerae]|uniref:Uncharacterized protein n=1 Tax=Sutcliffiella rhizosphaerae TaxID=2880967 RepID=A0ABM8YKJ5_9BACI|nr:hypothetical protein [Sutcliffiella rhizosphaerae]CAG9620451.1 hypothetical protein BACCIP111883_01219 [Sutcliffiella rhizosphaerae]
MDFRIRTQFTFSASDRKLNRILESLANEGIAVNGYFQTLVGKRYHFVRMVVGYTDEVTNHDVPTGRTIMEQAEVHYKENQVIQLLENGACIPNTFWRHKRCRALYLGEDNTFYLDVANVSKTIELLSEENSYRGQD